MIEIADCLQPLIKAFYLGLVFRTQNAVSRRWRLLAFATGGEHFTPVLTIRNTVDQSIARVTAKMPEETVAGVQITRVDEQEAGIVEQRDPDNQR